MSGLVLGLLLMSATPVRAVDTHVHVGTSEMDRLVSHMDAVGIDWVLNLSGLWAGGPLEARVSIANITGRVLVATNLPWFAARKRADFPVLAAELVRRGAAAGARALKIEKGLGLGVVDPTGRLVPVDDPWLDPIFEAAGQVGLPVVIHTADPKAFWEPVDEKNERYEELTAHPSWSNYGEPIPSFEELLAQLMRRVKRHPSTIFVAVHFGNRAEDPEWVGRQLDLHPNLYIDLAARLPEIGRHDPQMLRKLFQRHRHRILFGTDLGLGPGGFAMLGSIGEEPDTDDGVGPYYRAHWRFLETNDKTIPSPTPIQGRWSIHGLGLSDETLDYIYRINAGVLFGPAPAKAVRRVRPPYYRFTSASP